MKPFTALSGLALAALLLTGCSQTMPDTREADAKAIKDNEVVWNQDWAARNVGKLVAHYAGNAVLMAPGMSSTSGKEAIRKALTEMLADPAVSLKFRLHGGSIESGRPRVHARILHHDHDESSH